MNAPGTNLLLSHLSAASQLRMLRSMTHVSLPFRTLLYSADQTPSHAYLLTSGLASVVSTTAEGNSAEIGMIAREGLIGCLHVLGPATDPADCFMQTDGSGWKIALRDLNSFFDELPDLRLRVLEFSQCYCCVLSKIACCNRLHEAEPRLARWLTMAESRLQSGDLPFTHDLLGILMGASRPTVTLAIRDLQQRGILQNVRGRLSISKPKDLEVLACDCLPSIQERIRSLYRERICP